MSTLRRQRRVEYTRLDILEAAGRAFARKGFDRTTMQDIASESGYTAASLYAYFPGKNAIVAGLLDLLEREILDTFEAPLPKGLTFGQRIELLVRRQLELGDRRREAMAVFIECGRASSALQLARGTSGFELYVPRLTAWLSAAAKPRDLGGLTAEQAAVFFAGLSHGFFHTWLLGRRVPPVAERAALLVRLFLHGVGPARRPSPPRRRSR